MNCGSVEVAEAASSDADRGGRCSTYCTNTVGMHTVALVSLADDLKPGPVGCAVLYRTASGRLIIDTTQSISSPQASVFRVSAPRSKRETVTYRPSPPSPQRTRARSSPDPTWAMSSSRARAKSYSQARAGKSTSRLPFAGRPSPRGGASNHIVTMPTATALSSVPSTSTSESDHNFASIFNAALETYKRETKIDLESHPLLSKLQSCDSPEAILNVIREQIPASRQSQNGGDRLTKWLTPTVNVLYSFSTALGGDVGLVNVRTLPREKFLL